MKIRLWLVSVGDDSDHLSLNPFEISAPSLKQALRYLMAKSGGYVLYEAERWTGKTWKKYKRFSRS